MSSTKRRVTDAQIRERLNATAGIAPPDNWDGAIYFMRKGRAVYVVKKDDALLCGLVEEGFALEEIL